MQGEATRGWCGGVGAGTTTIQSVTSLICRATFMSCLWVGGEKAWHADRFYVGAQVQSSSC